VNYEWLKYGELIGRAFKSIYESTKEFTSFRTLDIEMEILDSIKRDFGHVPTKTYNYRFEKFKEKLKDIYFAYEPVVELGKHNPEIQSWEALARDPDTQKAPVGLFKTAELWGPAFITELDSYCLQQSINTYLELWKNEHHGHSLDPLAVNVYPDTIFRTAYKEKLEEILEKELIKSRQLVLEISEKRPIPTIDLIREHVFGYYDPVEEFVKTISGYIMDLNISFAIDDFGVGHSSISRLHRINLDHVKIDRDILLNPFPEHTIDYVRKSVNARHLHPDKIIVEGFDGKSRISLKKLYDHGIRLVQGHMIRRASPSVSHLNDEERDFIIKQLTTDEAFENDD
jgi:EAL domain-containing protein (putative c-di-GMP-specific phosphodiesterase class I)